MPNLHVDGVRRPQLHTVAFDNDTPEVAVAATQGDRLAVMDLQSALALLPADQREVLLPRYRNVRGIRSAWRRVLPSLP